MKPTPKPPSASYSKFTLQTANLPKLQYPVPISLNTHFGNIDTKSAKQIANNNRKTFFGPREISADSGISLNSSNSGANGSLTKKPRNLQMVLNGRHKFEVRDILDTTEELLNLPSLPSVFDTTSQPIPLFGLVRSNTVIERELLTPVRPQIKPESVINRPKLDEVFEEKLSIDCSTTEKHSKQTASIKEFTNSSSSSRGSWGNAGESMAAKDFSTISSSEDNKTYDDNSLQSISEFPSTENNKPERPNNLNNINETKFAEMAAAACDFLLDDETSPTDSLVSTGSDDEEKQLKKKKNEEIQERTLEDISPELECSSPLSPGTPTHASNSLSDMGRDFLIDDEIADQPALLFNDTAESSATPSIQNLVDQLSLGGSMMSLKSGSKVRNALQAAIELNLKTPDSVKKAVFERTESLDTLSPCESLASDDFMMDFDCSSIDSHSIDR